MGLDISIYKNVKMIDKLKINFDGNEEDDYLKIYEQDFEKQLDDLIVDEYYDYDFYDFYDGLELDHIAVTTIGEMN